VRCGSWNWPNEYSNTYKPIESELKGMRYKRDAPISRLSVDSIKTPVSPFSPSSPSHAITHYPFTPINSPDHSHLTVYCNYRWWNSRPSVMTKGAQGRIKATHRNTVANIYFFLSCLRLYRWERPNGREVEMRAHLLDIQVVSADYIRDWHTTYSCECRFLFVHSFLPVKYVLIFSLPHSKAAHSEP
jgi:hypothetical protein